MRPILLALALTAACTSDDAITPDATACPPPVQTLPRCGQIDPGCATGAIPLDCPHAEDTSVCWCPAQVGPGWCFTP